MKIELDLDYDEAVELCAFLARQPNDIAVDVAAQMQDDIQDEDERRGVAHAEAMLESGGTDDSKYRRDMIDAGRGYLLR